MLSKDTIATLLGCIEQQIGIEFSNAEIKQVSGGDTHQAYQLTDANIQLFIKINTRANNAILESEHRSLSLLSNTEVADLYPKPLAQFEFDDFSVLAMSLFTMVPIDRHNAEQCGSDLARQHANVGDCFGWPVNNYIGSTPQGNAQGDSWLVFFRDQRLHPQLEWAAGNGLSIQLYKQVQLLIDRLPEILPADIKPRLVHGDLWSGNLAYRPASGKLALYDPAPYYGDSEADIAMTKLFGRLDDGFYQAYRRSFPAPNNEVERHAIYNLYHALNHFNLFGSSYEGMIYALLRTFV